MKKLSLLFLLIAFNINAQTIPWIYTNGLVPAYSNVTISTGLLISTNGVLTTNGAAGAGTVTGITNTGAGVSLINNSNAPVPILKSLTNGANITLTDNGTNISIASSGGGAGSQTPLTNNVNGAGFTITNVAQFGGVAFTNTALSANQNIDGSATNFFIFTLTGSVTLTVTNIPTTGMVTVKINGDGSHTVSWVNVNWPNQVAPVQTLSHTDIYTIQSIGGDFVGIQTPNIK